MVRNDYYKTVLETAQNELSDLMLEKAGINDRIAKLRESILALSKLVSEDLEDHPLLAAEFVQLSEVGLTDAIRGVLKNANAATPESFLIPTDVRDRLKAAQFNLDKYKNEMAAITTVLYRLDDLGQVETGKNSETEKTGYRWKVEESEMDQAPVWLKNLQENPLPSLMDTAYGSARDGAHHRKRIGRAP
jgi:hypothetical protein